MARAAGRLAWGVASSAAQRTVPGRLRILAYHGVPDPDRFSEQIDHLVANYDIVSGAQVVEARNGRSHLPKRPVWLTFDDGRLDVVHHGQEVLDRAGVQATLFVCPEPTSRPAPLWFDQMRGAGTFEVDGRMLEGDDAVRALKALPDERRRQIVAAVGPVDAHQQAPLSIGDLETWTGSGHEVGNHSWDHPCMHRCEAEEQDRQVELADAWLREHLPGQPRIWAYPNGDWSEAAERALQRLGYEIGLLFDHRLASFRQHPLRLSRLRVSSDAPLERFRTIVSGAHPLAYEVVRRVRSTG